MSGHTHDSHTRRRTEANRENARRSTGPKDTTSTRFNAVKHGLLAEGVTELDFPETFLRFCARLEAELKPVGEVETFLARRIALGMVRLKRAALLEAEYTTGQLNPPVTANEGGWEEKLKDFNGTTVVLDPGLPARLSAEGMQALGTTFARYETAIENRLFRAMNQLQEMQRWRRGEKLSAPASVNVTVHADGPALASFGNPPLPVRSAQAELRDEPVCAGADWPKS